MEDLKQLDNYEKGLMLPRTIVRLSAWKCINKLDNANLSYTYVVWSSSAWWIPCSIIYREKHSQNIFKEPPSSYRMKFHIHRALFIIITRC